MLKKTLTFLDLDGNSVTEDFYFNLNKAELIDMATSSEAGLETYLKELTKENPGEEIMRLVQKIIVSAVGKRSEDGRRFIKNQDIIDDFVQTDAYSALLMELMQDPTTIPDFINAILPTNLQEELQKIQKAHGDGNVTDLQLPGGEDNRPAWIKEDRDPTDQEVRDMTGEQLKEAYVLKAQRDKGASQG